MAFMVEGVSTTRNLTSIIRSTAYTGNAIIPSGLTTAPLKVWGEVLTGRISSFYIPILRKVSHKRMSKLLPPSTNILDTKLSPIQSLITRGYACGRLTSSRSWSEKTIRTFSSQNCPPEMVLTYLFMATVFNPLSSLLPSKFPYLLSFSSFPC